MTDRQPGPDDRFDDPFEDQQVVDRAFAELIAHWADGPLPSAPTGDDPAAGSAVGDVPGGDIAGGDVLGPGAGHGDVAGQDVAGGDVVGRAPVADQDADAADPATDGAAIEDLFRDLFATEPAPPPSLPVTRAVTPPPPDAVPVEREERYIPPPVGWPRPSAPVLLGWTGITAAVVIMLLAAFGLALPSWAGWAAVLAFAIGFGILLSRLPPRRPPGSGDGAVL